jgi:glycine cleavage system H protein
MTEIVKTALVEVGGFPVALDRMYEARTHMWVAHARAGDPVTARIGLDALGVETNGTLAQLSLPAAGEQVTAGRPFGQLEAAKFVGPLVSPVSGTVIAANEAAAADPGLAERDPYGDGWLIEVSLTDPRGWPDGLVSGREEIVAWFEAEVGEYRLKGVIAQ